MSSGVYVRTAETREALSRAAKKRYTKYPHPMLGKKMPLEVKKKISESKKGCKVSEEARKRFLGRGADSYRWKGDAVGYRGLHNWVASRLGKPDKCEHCGRSGLEKCHIHWANISGEYKRELSDFMRLCAKCHKQLDVGIISL